MSLVTAAVFHGGKAGASVCNAFTLFVSTPSTGFGKTS
jgi:hypothetical protein